MGNAYLQEAFQALDILNEEDFNLGTMDGAKDAEEFLNDDEDKIDFTDVIDPEATTEEEVKDSYIGDVILDCCVCHSKLYKSPDEVHIDEEEGLVNVDEECPFCYSTDGYTIIGEVAPYGEEQSEEDTEEIEIEDDEEEIEESLKRNRKLTEGKDKFNFEGWYEAVRKALYDLAKKWKAPDEIVRDACSYYASEWENNYFGPYHRWSDTPWGGWSDFDEELEEGIFKKKTNGTSPYKIGQTVYFDGEPVKITELSKDPDAPDYVGFKYHGKRMWTNDISPVKEGLKEDVDPNVAKAKAKANSSKKGTTFQVGSTIIFDFGNGPKRTRIEDIVKGRNGQVSRVKIEDPDSKEKIWVSARSLMGESLKEDASSEDELSHALYVSFKQKEPLLLETPNSSGTIRKIREWCSNHGLNCVDYTGPEDIKNLSTNDALIIPNLDKTDYAVRLEVPHIRGKAGLVVATTSSATPSHPSQNGFDTAELGMYRIVPLKKYDESFRRTGKLKEGIFSKKDYSKPQVGMKVDFNGRKSKILEIHGKPEDMDYYMVVQDLKTGKKYRTDGEKVNESFRRRKGIKEHFEKVEIETDKDRMEMTSDENGKVVVTTEPKGSGEEMIVPVSDEIQSEINPKYDVPENSDIEDMSIDDTMVDEENPDDYEDIDVNDFSEEDFDDLGESYLKRVYENVDSFKTSRVRSTKNKLVVEGVIGFKSGAKKKTSFVFESKDTDNKGRVRFIGENLQMSRGKKSFTLTGSVNNGKFIAESLNYNYRQNGVRVYGTAKRKR